MSKKSSDIEDLYMNTTLSSNMEDYIETIEVLSTKNKIVRVKDIAGMLNIKMPSVTAALNKLKDMNLIDYEKYGYIELTEEGKYLAQKIYHRHTCLTEFFQTVMKIDSVEAEHVACRMEHEISAEACGKIHRFLEFFRGEESRGMEWTRRLNKCLVK